MSEEALAKCMLLGVHFSKNDFNPGNRNTWFGWFAVPKGGLHKAEIVSGYGPTKELAAADIIKNFEEMLSKGAFE